MLSPSDMVKSYAEPMSFADPMAWQFRYESGSPTVTATTIRATSSKLSIMVVIRNGRMLSRKRMNVMTQ